MLADSELLIMISVENCWLKFWFQLNFLSSSFTEISDFNSDDEFSKELIKSNMFMFFYSDFIKIVIFNF